MTLRDLDKSTFIQKKINNVKNKSLEKVVKQLILSRLLFEIVLKYFGHIDL